MQLFRLIKNILFAVLYTAFALCGLYACASIGSPQGGAYDLTPPVFISSKPKPNAVNFNENKIELVFDELISIEKPSEKVIITPPQKKAPVIKSTGNKITVELKDSLLPNTTYTFDFTDGIVDNNEKNAIEGFSFAFSTGEVVDSMVISGLLLNAENLEPMPNTLIGLHTNLDDTAFTHLPFVRTTQTNDRGRFWVRNVAPGTYRVYALNDVNRDYKFDQPGEAIAFLDSLVVPGFEPAVRQDTVWKDSLTIDTIKPIHYNRFTPDNLTLFLFKEDFENQYLSKTERPERYNFTFHFNSKDKLPPKINLQDKPDNNDWFITEFSDDRKSITYWITDSLVYKQDTLTLEANYWADDSLYNLVPVKDTIDLIFRKKEAPKKKDKEKEAIDFLGITVSASSTMDVFDTVKIVFSEPVLDLDTSKIQIQQKVDTLWESRQFPVVQDTLNPRMYYVMHKWPYGEEYQITIDSAAFTSVYGKWNNKTESKFRLQKEEEYGHLYVSVQGVEGPGIGELLDNSDKVVRKSLLRNGEIVFQNLKPGKYYLRYIVDLNGNGRWDPGNYAEKRQAEQVCYFPAFLELRKYSEVEQTWNVKDVPVEKQKPLEITKNKPVVKKPKRDEQTNANRSGSNQPNGSRANTNQSRGSNSSSQRAPMPR